MKKQQQQRRLSNVLLNNADEEDHIYYQSDETGTMTAGRGSESVDSQRAIRGSSSSLGTSSYGHKLLFSSPSGGRNASSIPPHHRRFTPHSYFSNTLREVVAGGDGCVVIIPQIATELHLRKRMFAAYQQDSIRTCKEYETKLRDIVNKETIHYDVYLTGAGIRKRYLFLRSDETLSTASIPLQQDLINILVDGINGTTGIIVEDNR